MTPQHGRVDRDGDRESGCRKIKVSERIGPTTRRAADHHYLAVVAAEIHRLARELGATARSAPLGADGR
jgi:hypothetical protein